SIGRWDFHGPFNAPSTALFNDFHDRLAEAYGIHDVVQEGRRVVDVQLLSPTVASRNDPVFLVSIQDSLGSVSTVKTRRLVCALGPAVPTPAAVGTVATLPWEAALKSQLLLESSSSSPTITIFSPAYSDYVLKGPQILEWLSNFEKSATDTGDDTTDDCPNSCRFPLKHSRILIVGGGITSGHLALVATAKGASSVTFVQRSPLHERQFDVDSAWMGPGRGKLQDDFAALSLKERSQVIREARGGGSISPEVVRLLSSRKAGGGGGNRKLSKFTMKECVEIDTVQLQDDGSLEATLDDGSTWQGDMIWLATGFANKVENHAILAKLNQALPIETVDGLPVLNSDLSWGCSRNDEDQQHQQQQQPSWKETARRRCYVMGAMAALELGPDALNLMGARRGAVHVAKAIRNDLMAAAATAAAASADL
ncbi:MAG: hypothetical protein SGARI_005692, partial [Bacillariaceae sp.]